MIRWSVSKWAWPKLDALIMKEREMDIKEYIKAYNLAGYLKEKTLRECENDKEGELIEIRMDN